MWRVVSNLIANAIKFSPTGAIINVVMKVDAGHVLIAVEDYGIGVPEEMKDKIFDMYTEAKRPGTAGEQPFGLGLAISKQIVEAHNGRIWFVSRPGNGTTFFVQLPVLGS
jgi:signal transduction histidine kinase